MEKEDTVALSKSLIAIIGRVNPAIYDFVFPHGHRVEVELNPQPLPPVARAYAELNPQPLPPVARAYAELNPQPLPPGVEIGANVGHELVRAAGFARAFGLRLKLSTDDICPPPRGPWPWPFPWPGPWPGPDEEWEQFAAGYALGLGATLEATSEVWERFDDAGLLESLHSVAAETAGKQFG